MNDRLKMQVKDMGPDDVEDMFNDLREKGGGMVKYWRRLLEDTSGD